MFDICKLFNKVSESVFASLLSCKRISFYDILKYKGIVLKYGNVLRTYILNNYLCVSVLLHVYEQDYTGKEKLILPAELSGQDICNYLESYIDSDNPNPNYLSDIENMRCTKQFPITDEIRLKARRRNKIECEKIFERGTHLEYEYQVSFNPNQKEEKNATNSVENGIRKICLSYSTKWLEETLDFPSILNNFIYIFEFADVPQMRCIHVSKKSHSGIFEDVFSSKSSRFYCCNHSFNFSQAISMMQMTAYYDFLKRNNISLEDVLHWFFTEYLQEEYACPVMRFSMPSSACTYSEKCSSIITAFESAIKQYCLFVKNGDIDFELVTMSTTPVLFENIASQIEGKYVYGIGEDYNRITFMLFSNQCMFSYVKRIRDEDRNYECFFDLLLKEDIYLSDYREEEKSAFEYLSDFDLLTIDDGKIKLKDKIKLAILKDLYHNEVISQKHYPNSYIYAFKEFMEKGLIIEKSTLFTQPEIDYLNYLLNRSEYTNGLEIRNKYIHGIQQVINNEEEHKQNYYILLKLFVLLAIKINDDFELKNQEDKTQL